jgi:hypothetical protein
VQSSFTPKDWIAITISILALVVSAGSAYYNVIQKLERVSLSVQFAPMLSKKGNVLTPRDEETYAVFINSGNRPATIVNLEVLFVQHRDRLEFNCYPEIPYDEQIIYRTDLKPFVLKENEIVVKTVKLGPRIIPGQRTTPGAQVTPFPVMKTLTGQSEVSIEVCFDVSLLTPSLIDVRERVSVMKYDVAEWGSFYGSDIAELLPNTPTLLINRRMTIFGE